MEELLEKFWAGSKEWFKWWGYMMVLVIALISITIYNRSDKREIEQILVLFIGAGIAAFISWVLLGIAITAGSNSACGIVCVVIGGGAYLYVTQGTAGNKVFRRSITDIYGNSEPI